MFFYFTDKWNQEMFDNIRRCVFEIFEILTDIEVHGRREENTERYCRDF